MRAVHLIRKPGHALLWLLISAGISLLLRASFLPEAGFPGFAVFLLPLIVLFSAALGGILPAMASVSMFTYVSFSLYGNQGLWFLVYLAPMAAAFLYCLEKEIPFFKTAAIVLASYVVGVLFIYLVMQRVTEGNLFGVIAQEAVNGLEGMPLRDSFLMALWRGGFLQHGQEAGELLFEPAPGLDWTFKPEVLEQFYRQIDARIKLLLAGLLPSLLTSNALNISLLGTGITLKAAARYQTAPNLAMPPFSTWHLPKEAGRRMLVLALGYFLTFITTSALLRMAGQLMYNVFNTLFCIQGLAYINHSLKRRGTKRSLRFIALIVVQAVLPFVATLMGVFDQFSDPRKLRETPSPA